MNRGWRIGSAGFKKAVSGDLAGVAGAVRLEADELKEFNRARWAAALERRLRIPGKAEAEAAGVRRSEPWKVAIATKLKRETSATNRWIAERLSMGAPNAVSDYCGKYVRSAEERCPFARKLNTER